MSPLKQMNQVSKQTKKKKWKRGKMKSKQEQNLRRVTSITRNIKATQDGERLLGGQRKDSDQISLPPMTPRERLIGRGRALGRTKTPRGQKREQVQARKREKHSPRGRSRGKAESY